MEERGDTVYLKHVLDAIAKIEDQNERKRGEKT